MNIVTIKMVTMLFLTCAVLEYIDNLPVLFFIILFNILNDNILTNTIYSAVLSLLNSKKAVRIQQFTDGATSVEKTLSYRIE